MARPKGTTKEKLNPDSEAAIKRKERVAYLNKQLFKTVPKFYNKHNLVYYKKPFDKALVLGWIQIDGEDEVVSKVLVDIDKVDSVTLDILMKEHKKGTKVET